MRPVALTSLTGLEFFPTFSPDGEQVAFSWNGTKQDNWDVYVTLVGASDVRRLTSDPGEDARPTWSPDGRQIAFVRQRADDSTIHLVSPLGGSERRLGDFRGADSLDWSPDGEWLAAGRSGQLNFGFMALFPRPGGKGRRGIYLVSLKGGDARPLIVSTSNSVDSKPAFSPDGRRLAYVVLRLFRPGHDWGARLRCGCGRIRYIARHCAAAPPPDDAAVPVHLLAGLDARRQRHHLRCRRGDAFELWLLARDDRWRTCARAHRGRRAIWPRRQPSPGRAIGWRSHACRPMTTFIDSKQAVGFNW